MLDMISQRHDAPALFADSTSGGGVTFAVADVPVRFVLRGAAAVGAIDAAFAPLPIKPCRAEVRGGRAALWLGPDEWLLIDQLATDPGYLRRGIETALVSVPHSLVDVTHRQLGLTVTGPNAADALAMFVPLDLAEVAYPVGMVTRTIFEKAEIVLWRRAVDAFHLEVWQSFAPYVAALLVEAQRELAATQ